MRKPLLIMFLVSLVISVLPLGAGAAETGGFKDTGNHWAKTRIDGAVARGYVSGYPDGTFRPDHTVTRAEFIRMLVDALHLPHSQGGDPWFQPYVAAALESGLLLESDFTDYANEISRLEIMRMVSRGLAFESQYSAYLEAFRGLYNGDLPFVDYREIADADLPHIALAFGAGIVNGYPDASIGLRKTATRAEVVVMIENLLKARVENPESKQYLQELKEVAETGTNARVMSNLEQLMDIDPKEIVVEHANYTAKLKRVYVLPIEGDTVSLYERKFLWNRDEILPQRLENTIGVVIGVLDMTFKKDLSFNFTVMATSLNPGMNLFAKEGGLYNTPRIKYGYLQTFLGEEIKVTQGSTHEVVLYGYYNRETSFYVRLTTNDAISGESYSLFFNPNKPKGSQ